MAALLITIGAIWMFLALLVVLALCGAAAQPLPKTGAVEWSRNEENLETGTSFVSQPASVR
jgi:hypothetical protein